FTSSRGIFAPRRFNGRRGVFIDALSGVWEMLKSDRSLTALRAAIAGLLAISAGCAYNSSPGPNGVRVEVANVGVDKEGMPYVVLEDSSGGRVLPIMIGESEAQGIAL